MGMCADFAIHDTDGHNPHAHICTYQIFQFRISNDSISIRKFNGIHQFHFLVMNKTF